MNHDELDYYTSDAYTKLSHQQQRFCDLYLTHFNAFKAAVEAGYSENTSRKGALLHVPKIQRYLKEAMGRRSQRLEITHDMILRELSKIAFANMGNYYDEDAMIKPMNKLTVDEKAAIAYYEVFDHQDADGNYLGTQSKIKLHNKMAALDRIARHVGFYGAMGKSGSSSGRKSGAFSPESEVKSQEREMWESEEVAARAVAGEDTDDGKLVKEMVVVDRSTNNLPMDYPEAEDAAEIEGIDLKTLVALEDLDISPGVPRVDVPDESESPMSESPKEERGSDSIENILTISPLRRSPIQASSAGVLLDTPGRNSGVSVRAYAQ